MSDKEPPIRGFVPKRATSFQQHQKRIEQLLTEGMYDKGWKDEAFARYNELEDAERVVAPERMAPTWIITAEGMRKAALEILDLWGPAMQCDHDVEEVAEMIEAECTPTKQESDRER